MKYKMTAITVTRLRLDFQPAENLDEETICRYEEKLRHNRQLDPVIVRFDGTNYWLQDGFHRVEAAKRLGRKRLRAEIIPGSLADMETEWQQHMAQLKKELAAEATQRKLQKTRQF